MFSRCVQCTVNPLYTDTRYNDKIRYIDNLTFTKSSLEVIIFQKLCKNIAFNTLDMFWIQVYLLESTHLGDSNKYLKHMFYDEIRTKQDVSYISICSLSILYNSKFILLATSLEINVVVVTRVQCNSLFCLFLGLTS